MKANEIMSKKSRKGARQRRNGFVFSLVSVIFVFVLILLSMQLFFKIKSIEVVGNTKISSEDIRIATGYSLGGNIFLINKNSASKTIYESFAYVKKVTIKRRLPGVVQVIIEEATPACVFEENGYYWYVDKNGKILESKAGVGEAYAAIVKNEVILVPVVGQTIVLEDSEGEKMHALIALLETLDNAEYLEKITEINLQKSYEISFIYENRLRVYIGMPDDLEYKLKYIGEAIKYLDGIETASFAELDVSMAREKNPSLRLRN